MLPYSLNIGSKPQLFMKSIHNVLIIKTEWQEGEMKKMQRMTYLDCAKGVAIILVVLGHIDMGNNPLNNWIYSFHMPLFFVLSGMLMSYKNKHRLMGEC